MSPEETKANVRMYEDDILGGLMAAAAYKTDMDEVAKIQIIRHKAVVLEFRIRPLSEDEYVKIKKRNTNYKMETEGYEQMSLFGMAGAMI